MISKKTIDEILFAAKIEEVVGDFVALKRQGQNFVGLCPFHDDRNPSLYVSPRLGIYKCFVCDAKGNAIRFLMEHEKLSYPEALHYLADKYGITIEEDHPETAEELKARNERESLYTVNAYAEKYFMEQLRNSEEGRLTGMNYFKERGFKESTMDKFHLGYNPEGWDNFTKTALKQGYKEEYLLTLGLTKKNTSGRLYDFYRGRVIFPIHSATGKVIGFGGRILKKNDKTAKYVNSPESEIYHKSDTLYDFYLAKKAIRSRDNVYLVEGYTDVISMMEAGIENVVASSGTSLTEGQIKILRSQTKNITVLYDGDEAGIKASLRGVDLLLSKGMNVKIILLPNGEDPDSFAKKHRDSELQDFLQRNATDFLLFKAKILSKEAGTDPLKRAAMVNEIIRSIADVPDHIARAFYIKECANMFELAETTLNGELRRQVWRKFKGTNTQDDIATATITAERPTPATDLMYEAEKNLIILLLKYGLYEITIEKDTQDDTSEKTRIDQYIYNELNNEDIVPQYPLLHKIYDLYPTIAATAREQDEIKRFFTMNADEEVSDFADKYLLVAEPAYSPAWRQRYDKITNTVLNDVQTLQTEVQNTLLAYKLRLIENYLAVLRKEMDNADYDEEDKNRLIEKYNLSLQCRKDITQRLNMVVSR